MQEKTFYNDDIVIVTDKRAKIRNQTYPISSISSVNIKERPPDIMDYVPGCFFALIAITTIFVTLSTFTWNVPFGIFLVVLLNIAPAIIAYKLFVKQRTKYVVQINLVGGEWHTLESEDNIYAKKIADAITEALINRD